jgi:hypothetical protein
VGGGVAAPDLEEDDDEGEGAAVEGLEDLYLSISALMILPFGPVPLIENKGMPFSSARRLAMGEADTIGLSPVGWIESLEGADEDEEGLVGVGPETALDDFASSFADDFCSSCPPSFSFFFSGCSSGCSSFLSLSDSSSLGSEDDSEEVSFKMACIASSEASSPSSAIIATAVPTFTAFDPSPT